MHLFTELIDQPTTNLVTNHSGMQSLLKSKHLLFNIQEIKEETQAQAIESAKNKLVFKESLSLVPEMIESLTKQTVILENQIKNVASSQVEEVIIE